MFHKNAIHKYLPKRHSEFGINADKLRQIILTMYKIDNVTY